MQLFKSTNYYLRVEPRQEKHEDFAKERHDFLHEKVVDFNAVPRPKQDHFAKERQDAFLNQKVANFNSFHVASPVHSPVPTPVFFHTPPPSTSKPDTVAGKRDKPTSCQDCLHLKPALVLVENCTYSKL